MTTSKHQTAKTIASKLQKEAVNMDDFQLAELLSPYQNKKEVLIAFFDSAEGLFTDSPVHKLAFLAKRSATMRDRVNGRKAVSQHINQNGLFCLLQNKAGNKFGFFHTSVHGKPRLSYFDSDGWICHEDLNSIDEAPEAAFQFGMFKGACPEILDRTFLELGKSKAKNTNA